MIKIIDDWIVKRAKKLEMSKKIKEEAETKAFQEIRKKHSECRQKVKDILYKKIAKLAISKQSEQCHIKAGDVAILNKYELGRNGNNNWDGGTQSLIQHIKDEDKTKPIKVTISNVYVSQSLAQDFVDRFLDNSAHDNLSMMPEKDIIIDQYSTWLNNRRENRTPIGDAWGLYHEASFVTNLSFQPNWGLNVDCFLSMESEEGAETYKMWKDELSIDNDIKNAKARLEELEKQRKMMHEKYYRIYYR